jgi:hypothetical protein
MLVNIPNIPRRWNWGVHPEAESFSPVNTDLEWQPVRALQRVCPVPGEPDEDAWNASLTVIGHMGRVAGIRGLVISVS